MLKIIILLLQINKYYYCPVITVPFAFFLDRVLLVLLVLLVSPALVDHLGLRGQLDRSAPKEHLYVLNIKKKKEKKEILILEAGMQNDDHLLFSVFLYFYLLFREILVLQDSREKLDQKEKL